MDQFGHPVFTIYIIYLYININIYWKRGAISALRSLLDILMLLPIYLFPLVLLVHIYIPALSLFSCKILFLSFYIYIYIFIYIYIIKTWKRNCAFSYTFTGLGRLVEKALYLSKGALLHKLRALHKLSCTSKLRSKLTVLKFFF